MTAITELRAQRDAIAKDIHAMFEDKNKAWNDDDNAKYQKAMAELGGLDEKIKRYNDAMAAIGVSVAAQGQISDDLRNQFTRTEGAHHNREESRALRAFMAGGVGNMVAEDRQRMYARQSGDIANAMALPQAAMSTTTPNEGGYTVATEYYRELTQAMKQFGGIRSVARTIQTGTGSPMIFPTADATSEEGEIVGQNIAVSAADTTFGNMTLDVFKYSSKSIAVPFELIQDSMFDIEGYINALLALRIGRITSKHFTNGTGVNQPRGIVTAAGQGKIGKTGQTMTVTYEDLVDLEHSVDPVYRAGPGVGFMMHDSTLKELRKLKDNDGRPIFVPGYEQGNAGGAPDRLLNRPIYLSQEMPTMGANAKSILFGDFSRYLIREVMDLTLFRMADSYFLRNGQIGFLAFNRQGGNMIDVGGAVKVYQNSAT
ncbi:phage major capsid protein [Chitinimonas sp. PSY-7]|uniref:phage major capsid protein n=1 Tax=Chitinimonas sp. PSY-7 TaxID=3459088 RepID=UPI00403FED89